MRVASPSHVCDMGVYSEWKLARPVPETAQSICMSSFHSHPSMFCSAFSYLVTTRLLLPGGIAPGASYYTLHNIIYIALHAHRYERHANPHLNLIFTLVSEGWESPLERLDCVGKPTLCRPHRAPVASPESYMSACTIVLEHLSLTSSTLLGSTFSCGAAFTIASTFSCVLARYPAIFAAFAAR